MPEGGEKTEQATPKKRRDERKKGNVFQSKDVGVILGLVIAFYVYSLFVSSVYNRYALHYNNQMQRIVELDLLNADELSALFLEAIVAFATTVLPPMLIIALVNIMATMLQTRFLFTAENLKFKLERINPFKGIKRLISLRSLVELAKSIIKIAVITWLMFTRIRGLVGYLPGMIDWDIVQALVFLKDGILSLVFTVAVAFGAIAALDFLYQRYEYEKGIKMTKQEIKEEFKQMEGNPEIKSKRRQKQREFAQMRMMQSVQEADVIVRNPTHFAVALKYTIDEDPAPMVLAKGADRIAQRIVEEGEKHGVTIVENKPLARGLYEAADVYGYIPAEFFQPVAELLAWLYTIREKKSS